MAKPYGIKHEVLLGTSQGTHCELDGNTLRGDKNQNVQSLNVVFVMGKAKMPITKENKFKKLGGIALHLHHSSLHLKLVFVLGMLG
jgi:hypothetical protein